MNEIISPDRRPASRAAWRWTAVSVAFVIAFGVEAQFYDPATGPSWLLVVGALTLFPGVVVIALTLLLWCVIAAARVRAAILNRRYR